MTATDELRRLLDERGVEYDTRDGKAFKDTYWNDGHGRRWGYTEDVTDSGITSPILFLVSGQLTFAPERAIAATLGAGTCRNTAPSYLDFLCSECGFVNYRNDENYIGGNDWHYCPNCGRRVVDA